MSFVCGDCNAKFTQNGSLKRHINSVHLNEKKFKCNQCSSYACSSLQTLREHINSKHLHIKPFGCPQCNTRCVSKKTLNRHIEEIHNEKQIRCHLCDYKCSRQRSLKSHISSAHEGKLIVCEEPFCGAKFTRSSSLIRHHDRMHSERGIQKKKIKEEVIEKLLTKANIFFEREVVIDFHCSDMNSPKKCARLDFVIEQPEVIFCLEIDEHQHEDYPVLCEITRMLRIFENITMSRRENISKPICFVRYNPDAFTIDEKPQRLTQKERQQQLLNFIDTYQAQKPFSIKYMFYDTKNGEATILDHVEYPLRVRDCVIA